MALAKMYPSLQFVVQMIEPGQSNNGLVGVEKVEDYCGRITVQKRMPAAAQVIKDAAVYILRLATTWPSLPTQILAELSAHLDILRANASATLILAPPLLPEPGTVGQNVEATARLRDLSRLQLINESGLELGELKEIVNRVHDSRGRLVVINTLRSRNGVAVALCIKYEGYIQATNVEV